MIRILYADAAGVIETIELMNLDAQHGLGAVPTEHPVEDGATVTDHIRPELDTYTARCLVSNTMLEPAGSHMGGIVQSSIEVDGVPMLGWSDVPDRVRLVFLALVDLMNARKPVTIETDLRRYESMAISRIVWPEAVDDGVELTLESKRIRIVSTQTISAPRPRNVRGRRTVNAGTVATTTPAAPPPPPPPDRSYLVEALF